jgi:hypothetical protein
LKIAVADFHGLPRTYDFAIGKLVNIWRGSQVESELADV